MSIIILHIKFNNDDINKRSKSKNRKLEKIDSD